MARIPYADLESLPDDLREEVRAFGDLNVDRMLAHTGPVMRHWHAVVGTLLTDPGLDRRIREIAILRIAHLAAAPYERRHHEEVAAAVGVDRGAIEATAQPEPDPTAFDGPQNAVLALVDALVLGHRVGDDVFGAVHDRLGDAATAKLVLLVGVYLTTAIYLNAFEVDMDVTARLRVGR